MAKKTNKIEENSENTTLVKEVKASSTNENVSTSVNTEISSEELMKDTKLWVAKEDVSQMNILSKPTLKSISLFDLLTLEKASGLICKRYENTVKMYDGTINAKGGEYARFKTYLDIHTNVLNEIEKRILEFK
jgi:hypothetical protein